MKKEYTILTKPYRIHLIGPSHKLAHSVQDNRFIDFKRGTEMWCCKVEGEDHVGGVSLLVFNHSWISSFALDSSTLKSKWKINTVHSGNWKDDAGLLNASYNTLSIYYPGSPERSPKEIAELLKKK